jgi:hypothetical protein
MRRLQFSPFPDEDAGKKDDDDPRTNSNSPSKLTFLLFVLALGNLILFVSNRNQTQAPGAAQHPELAKYEATLARASALLRGTAGDEHSAVAQQVSDAAVRAEELAAKAEGVWKAKEEEDREKMTAQHPPPPPPAVPASPPAPSSPSVLPASGPRKHLAIGMASGINPAQLAVFVGSLRKHSPPEQSEIVLFMDAPSLTEQVNEILAKYVRAKRAQRRARPPEKTIKATKARQLRQGHQGCVRSGVKEGLARITGGALGCTRARLHCTLPSPPTNALGMLLRSLAGTLLPRCSSPKRACRPPRCAPSTPPPTGGP